MNPLAWFPGAKDYLVIAVIGGLAGFAGMQTVHLAWADEALAEHKAAAAQLEADRARVALTDALRTSEKMAANAAAYQGISDALTKETARRQLAERSNGQLSAGLRDAFAASARHRAEAEASRAAGILAGDRPDTVDGLFAEAGDLLARSADLQEEARSIVQRRDAEVRALSEENRALRVLMDE